jgi:hypothetical protein
MQRTAAAIAIVIRYTDLRHPSADHNCSFSEISAIYVVKEKEQLD